MWPDRVSNPGPLTYESGALPTALRSPVAFYETKNYKHTYFYWFIPLFARLRKLKMRLTLLFFKIFHFFLVKLLYHSITIQV